VSEHCDGAIRLGKLEKFDKVNRQIKLAYQSNRNSVEGWPHPQNFHTSIFASLETWDGP
jgi:hypothetical protein